MTSKYDLSKKILKWLAQHPNSKLPAICVGVQASVTEISPILDNLIKAEKIYRNGYNSRLEEYYINEDIIDA